jgi:hypothetical protein
MASRSASADAGPNTGAGLENVEQHVRVDRSDQATSAGPPDLVDEVVGRAAATKNAVYRVDRSAQRDIGGDQPAAIGF